MRGLSVNKEKRAVKAAKTVKVMLEAGVAGERGTTFFTTILKTGFDTSKKRR
jgi:hypothetical protein